MSIEDELEKWARTAQGQAAIRTAIRRGSSSTSFVGTNADVDREVERLKRVLMEWIHPIIESIDASALTVGKPYLNPKTGDVCVDINFDPRKVHRDSLSDDEKWSDGVENIVLHMNRGWDAGGVVRGMWHGKPTVSRRQYPRPGKNDITGFMQGAVADYNRLSPDSCYVELSKDYDL